jgi:hypothetical protein
VREYLLDLEYLHTETHGPIFDQMNANNGAIASVAGMSGVFRLRGVDIHRVVRCAPVAGSGVSPAATPERNVLAQLDELTRRLALCTSYEEATRTAFGAHIASVLHALDPATSEPAGPAEQIATPALAGETLRLTYYHADDSVFADDAYVIKGAAGRILWKLLREHDRSGRDSFTNRPTARRAARAAAGQRQPRGPSPRAAQAARFRRVRNRARPHGPWPSAAPRRAPSPNERGRNGRPLQDIRGLRVASSSDRIRNS